MGPGLWSVADGGGFVVIINSLGRVVKPLKCPKLVDIQVAAAAIGVGFVVFASPPSVAATSPADSKCDDELKAEEMTPPKNHQEALRRAHLDNELGRITSEGNVALSAIRNKEMILDANYTALNISERQYFADKQALLHESTAVQVDAIDKKTAVLRDYCASRPIAGSKKKTTTAKP